MTAKNTAKTAPKTAEKKAAPAKKADGLRKPQVRVLKALVKAGKPLTRNEIAEKAGVDAAWLTEYIGSPDAEKRAKNDAKFKSLITLGLVKFAAPADEGEPARYDVTPKGRETSKKAE